VRGFQENDTSTSSHFFGLPVAFWVPLKLGAGVVGREGSIFVI